MDQGEKRTAIDVWEADSKIFNPLADWSWEDVRNSHLFHMQQPAARRIHSLLLCSPCR